jgi:hypothetical protein
MKINLVSDVRYYLFEADTPEGEARAKYRYEVISRLVGPRRIIDLEEQNRLLRQEIKTTKFLCGFFAIVVGICFSLIFWVGLK